MLAEDAWHTHNVATDIDDHEMSSQPDDRLEDWRLFRPYVPEWPSQWTSGVYGYNRKLFVACDPWDLDPESFFHIESGSTMETRLYMNPLAEWAPDEVRAVVNTLNATLNPTELQLSFSFDSPAPGRALALNAFPTPRGYSAVYMVSDDFPYGLSDILDFDSPANVSWTFFLIEIEDVGTPDAKPVILEFDIYLNSNHVSWGRSMGPKASYDCHCPPFSDCHDGVILSRPCRLHMQSVVLHEMMHGIGVAHCSSWPGNCGDCGIQPSVMCPDFHWTWVGTSCGGWLTVLRDPIDTAPLAYLY